MDPKPEQLPPNAVQPSTAQPNITQPAPSAPPRVLLVEDDAVNRILSSLVIKAVTGAEPDTACDGEEALEMASTGHYDLILMDLLMPGIGGVEAARCIRALPGPSARCPILALTASDHPADIQRCLAVGMNAHLLKPLLLDDLRAALKRWL